MYHCNLRVEDPVLNAFVSIGGLRLGLGPRALDLSNEAVLVLLGALLELLALGREVLAQLGSLPRVVGLNNVGFPVVLDEVLKVLAVSRSGVWDVVVAEPSLKLGLVPLVVDCKVLADVDRSHFFEEPSIAACAIE